MLHPFDTGTAFESKDVGDLIGRYGTGETPQGADAIRTELYKAMEKSARRHFLDKGYYLRVALAATAFVVVYLFFSILVRDPVPLIDELVLASLAAAAVFLVSERKVLSSPQHLESVLRLRRAIDGAYFSESRVVDLVESWRDEALALGPAAFYKTDTVEVKLNAGEMEEAASLCAFLAERWRSKPIVAELYAASQKGGVPGALLDKAARRLGAAENSMVLAYLRLIPLVLSGAV
ncbi:MAG: hypothetical protein CVV51_14610 [Spirochaetae bacterium HGW-Spirochaetae-7]|nr:MAG: hypothetical protein CVV51_14610 [Spirochaetae bacterium HGW-Spirochaetae-7]